MNLTVNDLIIRFGEQEIAELSDHENHREINYQVVNKAIEDAESAGRSRYNAAGLFGVPFNRAAIGKLADMAIFELSENGADEEREKRNAMAIAWFKELEDNPQLGLPDDYDGTGKAFVSFSKMVRG